MKIYFNIFFFLISVLSFQDVKSGNESRRGMLDVIITKALEAMRPALENLNINRQDFETGLQEFGIFKGQVKDLNIQGLEKFSIAVLKTSLCSIQNLTLVEKKFTMKGKYNVNGTLAFPLGKSDILLFGDGEMSVDFINFSVSIKAILAMENGTRVVKDVDMYVSFDRMKVYMKNLMGGGYLEKVFNDLINDVGLTVFNYYRQSLLDFIKPKVKDLISNIIKPKVQNQSSRKEL